MYVVFANFLEYFSCPNNDYFDIFSIDELDVMWCELVFSTTVMSWLSHPNSALPIKFVSYKETTQKSPHKTIIFFRDTHAGVAGLLCPKSNHKVMCIGMIFNYILHTTQQILINSTKL